MQFREEFPTRTKAGSEDYLRIASQATPWKNLIQNQSRACLPQDFSGWSVRYFENRSHPALLARFQDGFVTRAIRWNQPSFSPLYDLSFCARIMSMNEIPENLDDIRAKTLCGGCRRWHPNGVLAMQANYDNGSLHDLVRFWSESGKMTDKSEYKHGNLHGERHVWENNDSILVNGDNCWAKYTYREGTLDGPFTKWHPNGNIWLEGQNLNGQIHGMFNEYNDEGFRVFKTKYAHGQELWSRLAFGA